MCSKQSFDIVIGNPPYGDSYKRHTKAFFRKRYKSAKNIPGKQSGSLSVYSLFVERGLELLKTNGVYVNILPLSFVVAKSMDGIQQLIESKCSVIKIIPFAARPKPVFEQACIGTCILSLYKTNTPIKQLFTSKLYRRKSSLKYIINNIESIEVYEYKLKSRYPKISYPIEKSILSKLFKQNKTVKNYIDKSGEPLYFRAAGGRYFKIFTSYSTHTNTETSVIIKSKYLNAIGAILSSNLFFYYSQVYSDAYHLTPRDLYSFGLPGDIETQVIIDKLTTLYNKYLQSIEKHKTPAMYKIIYSKHIIDEIDDIICPLYGLTQEEIEFIKNYEIEFRKIRK